MNHKQFNKSFDNKQWNECLALALGWTYHTKAERWFLIDDSKPQGEKVIHYSFKPSDLPQWTTNKNLWVEGQPVIKYLQDNNVFGERTMKISEIAMVKKIFTAVTLPPLDYAKALVEVIKESQQ